MSGRHPTNSPLISVVLSAKDAGSTLPRAVESILAQTLTDFELILVDDRSTDATPEIAASFARKDPRVKVLRSKSPGGIVATLQTGTDAVSAPLLARMDADDFSHPERLAKQVAHLEAHPEIAACACRVRVPNPLGAGICRYVDWTNSLQTPAEIARGRFIDSPLVQPGVLLRTEAFHTVGGYRNHPWAEDYDLWLRMLDAGMDLGKHPEVLLDWYDSPGRLTRANDRYSTNRFLQAKAHYMNRLPDSVLCGFSVCGAGPTGKRLARYLGEIGAKIHTFYEVHPRRIGESIAGIPVRDHSGIPTAAPGNSPILISAVGQKVAREKIRWQASALGYHEGANFFVAA